MFNKFSLHASSTVFTLLAALVMTQAVANDKSHKPESDSQQIAHVMRHFMGQNGQSSHHTQLQIDHECRGNQDTIAKAVNAVTRQDGPTTRQGLCVRAVIVRCMCSM